MAYNYTTRQEEKSEERERETECERTSHHSRIAFGTKLKRKLGYRSSYREPEGKSTHRYYERERKHRKRR